MKDDEPDPRTGRPGLLVTRPDLHRRIVDTVRGGSSQETAAAAAGISRRQLLRWLARGRVALAATDDGDDGHDPSQAPDADRPYAKLAYEVDIAHAGAEVDAAAGILEMARGGQLVEESTVSRRDGSEETRKRYAPPDWRALAFWLERRRPDTWGRGPSTIVVPPADTPDAPGLDNRVRAAIRAFHASAGASSN